MQFPESLKMLNSEEGQLNAVYACFGSAAKDCQFFEAALSNFLLTYNRLLQKSLTLAELEAVETELNKKTMGMLLRNFEKHVKIYDASVSAVLSDALEKRNFLIHAYFRERLHKFGHEPGRLEMLGELVSIGQVLGRAEVLMIAMRSVLCEALEGGPREASNSNAVFTITVDIDE